MCTLSYLPTGNGTFLLGSNRDEAPGRSPVELTHDCSKSLLYPRDTLAGGTWLAVSSTGRLACLLNGAFEKHERTPPYRLSRGIVLLDSFDYESPKLFFEQYSFENIEPFTIVFIENEHITEGRWDGNRIHVTNLDASQPHFWSSCTLYPAPIREKRASWFGKWLSDHLKPDLDSLVLFHHQGGDGDPFNDLLMNRNNIVRTVSITGVRKTGDHWEMSYHDLLSDHISVSSSAINATH